MSGARSQSKVGKGTARSRADGARAFQDWGTVGQDYTFGSCGTDEDNPSNGVLCRVELGFVYQGPPPAGVGLRGWEPAGQELLRFAMPLGDDPIPPFYQTLADLAERLRQGADAAANSEIAPPHSEADRRLFDEAVRRLIRLAIALDGAGAWLGRVHPENVVIVQPDGPEDREVRPHGDGRGDESLAQTQPGGVRANELILTDWGFAFNGELRIGKELPGWVNDPSWSILWDDSPARMNQHLVAGSKPEGPRVDQRTLVRLIACLLVGRQEVERWCAGARPTAQGGSPLSSIPAGKTRTTSPVWTALKKALEGSLTLEGLHKALVATPPSDHFVTLIAEGRERLREEQERVRRRRHRRSLQLGVGIPLVLAALAGGFLGLKSSGILDPPKPTHPLCPSCPGESPLFEGLSRLDDAQKEASQVVARLEAGDFPSLAAALKPVRDAQIAALGGLRDLATADGRVPIDAERQCMAKMADNTLLDLRHDYERLMKRLDGISDDTGTECRYLDDLLGQVEMVQKLNPSASTPSWIASLQETRRWTCGKPGP